MKSLTNFNLCRHIRLLLTTDISILQEASWLVKKFIFKKSHIPLYLDHTAISRKEALTNMLVKITNAILCDV